MKQPEHKITIVDDKVIIRVEHFGKTIFTIRPDGYGIQIHGQYIEKSGMTGEEGLTILPVDEHTVTVYI